MDQVSKLWGGRFTKQTNRLVEEYTASIGFDKALAEEDVQGSLAHVTMLGKCGFCPRRTWTRSRKACMPSCTNPARRAGVFRVG
ncbi:hypothetical protein HMSSN036_24380 [Paenibacillus macerans]|nr:hypothetical protein HMSSN036_24380 [Paenibacillus macerans]